MLKDQLRDRVVVKREEEDFGSEVEGVREFTAKMTKTADKNFLLFLLPNPVRHNSF